MGGLQRSDRLWAAHSLGAGRSWERQEPDSHHGERPVGAPRHRAGPPGRGHAQEAGCSKGFLIDGYPREVAQGEEFEKAIAPCKHILYFEVSDETMTSRLLKRAETSGRADDNVDTIKKRLVTFHQHSEPVIKAYASKCSVIPAERGIDEIYADVTKALDSM